jgi:hypothetical protein
LLAPALSRGERVPLRAGERWAIHIASFILRVLTQLRPQLLTRLDFVGEFRLHDAKSQRDDFG